MDSIEERIRSIEERNFRVELEKAWEVSWCRCLCILAGTYLTAVLFLWIIADPSLFLHALVPTGGYLFSTLSLPWVKRWWIEGRTKDMGQRT